ncbi:hypothetical protein N7501_001876, partial [Penicillium viridicatum]
DSPLLEVYYPLSVCGNRWSILLYLLPFVITYLLVHQHSVRNTFEIYHNDRYRFNKTDRLNKRYVKFRLTELQRIASEVVQQNYCPNITKFTEGGFNKVFLLQAKNSREVIARIPTPIAGPPYYITASKVATINFLRSVLKLPVPEVLAYSTISNNPIGAKYTLIERVKGESLSLRIYILSLPGDFDKIGIEQQRQYRAVFRLEEANLYYTAAIDIHNKEHIDLLRPPYLGIRQYLLRETGISSAARLVIFSDKEREATILLSQVREHLDIDLEGGTEPDNFERAVEGNRKFRMEMVRQAEVDQHEISWRNWPYKDDEDDSMPPGDI